MKTFKKILKWLAISFMALVLIFVALFIISFTYSPEDMGKNQASVDWLPSSASEINFYERGGFGWIKTYNCKMKKSDFMKFADDNGWELKEDKYEQRFRQYNISDKDIIVKHALSYSKVFANSGGTRVVYDIENEKLYVSLSHR